MDNENRTYETEEELNLTEEAEVANESKEDKFRRIGTIRVNKALTSIERLGNLANKSAYAYTDEQVEAMLKALEGAIEAVKEKFYPDKKKNTFSF